MISFVLEPANQYFTLCVNLRESGAGSGGCKLMLEPLFPGVNLSIYFGHFSLDAVVHCHIPKQRAVKFISPPNV